MTSNNTIVLVKSSHGTTRRVLVQLHRREDIITSRLWEGFHQNSINITTQLAHIEKVILLVCVNCFVVDQDF